MQNIPPPPPGFKIDQPTSPLFQPRPVYRQRAPEAAPRHPEDATKDRVEAGIAEATREDQIRTARAQRIKAERDAARPDPEEVKRRRANQDQLADLGMIAQQLNRVQELYNQDLKGAGIGSLGEYLPTPKMQRFEAQSKALAVLMKPLIRSPGEGIWTDADQRLLERLVPTRFTSDADNEERLQAAKRFISEKAKKHGGRTRSEPIGKGRLPEGWSIEEE